MAPRKGTISNNPRGRPPGSANKVTGELKLWIKGLLDDNRELLQKDFISLSSKDRWLVSERLMQYTTPKMQNIEATLEYDRLTAEHLNMIVTDLLNNIENDSIR